MPMQMVTKVSAQDDPNAFDRVLSLIRLRYSDDFYEPVNDGSAADVEVTVTRHDAAAICVRDMPRHELLQSRLLAEFGKPRAQAEFAKVGEPATSAPDAIFRFRIDGPAQVRYFESFLAEVPEIVQSCFPITTQEASLEVRLHELELLPPTHDISSRWTVRSSLELRDTKSGQVLDAGDFGLCNFFGARSDGRVSEPGQRVGRPFDEVPARFRQSVAWWLANSIPQQMLTCAAAGELSIRRIFDFEG